MSQSQSIPQPNCSSEIGFPWALNVVRDWDGSSAEIGGATAHWQGPDVGMQKTRARLHLLDALRIRSNSEKILAQ